MLQGNEMVSSRKKKKNIKIKIIINTMLYKKRNGVVGKKIKLQKNQKEIYIKCDRIFEMVSS